MEFPCIPCQYGMHEDHIDYPEVPPEGVMGGQHCPCTGDCVERNHPEPLVKELSEQDWHMMEESMAFMRELTNGSSS